MLVTPPLPAGAAAPGADAKLVSIDRWSEEVGASLAVNANYFSTVPAGGGEEMAEITGLSVSDGVVVSPPRTYGSHADPALIFTDDHRAAACYCDGNQLSHVVAAVAGVGGSQSDPRRGTLLVDDRINLGDRARVDPEKRHPRTAAGVSRDGRTLWLVVVEGRQPDWSVGMTLPEVAEFLIGLGAYDAVNLDGGGSTTLDFRPGDGSAPVTNRPSDPAGFRPVANGLAFIAAPGLVVSSQGISRTEGD